MDWIDSEAKFKVIYQLALNCSATDSGRLATSLKKLTFNDVDILSSPFASLLQKLLERSGDENCAFVILRPDPVYYFHHHFGKYPVIEIGRGMSVDEYLSELNAAPPGSAADALGIAYREYVFVPPSFSWFIHALRSTEDDGGHLWLRSDWIDWVTEFYPYAGRPPLVKR